MKNSPITYSKNIFIPVTNVCRNKCAYCGFQRSALHKDAFLMTEKEVISAFEKGAAAQCTEVLFTFGESPEEEIGFLNRFGKQLRDSGFETVIEYTAELCRLALEHGLLPHVNGGVLSFEELKKIAPLNASMGLMLETTADLPAHKDCPGKVPAVRLEMIENAGKLKMPFTTGLLIGIGETRTDWVNSLLEIQNLHDRYGHIQEIILQNYTPNSGQTQTLKQIQTSDELIPIQEKIFSNSNEPISNSEKSFSNPKKPISNSDSLAPSPNDFQSCALNPPTKQDMIDLILLAKKILSPDISIQVPPNLIPPLELIQYGVTDLGGISPVTIDYINPESAWPEIENMKALLNSKGYEFKERLPVHPKYVKAGWYGSETKKRILELSDEDGYRKY